MKPKYHAGTSRRSMVKGTIAGIAGLSTTAGLIGGGIILSQQGKPNSAHAAANRNAVDSIQTILNIAITAEELGITFYTHVLAHAGILGLSEAAFLDLRAALI